MAWVSNVSKSRWEAIMGKGGQNFRITRGESKYGFVFLRGEEVITLEAVNMP